MFALKIIQADKLLKQPEKNLKKLERAKRKTNRPDLSSANIWQINFTCKYFLREPKLFIDMRYTTNRKVNANARLMFDTRIRLKDGTYTVKLEVAYGNKKRRFATGVKITGDQWSQMNLSGLQEKFLKKQRDVCKKSLVKARKIIEEMNNEGEFDFDQFACKYAGKIPKEIEDRITFIRDIVSLPDAVYIYRQGYTANKYSIPMSSKIKTITKGQ